MEPVAALFSIASLGFLAKKKVDSHKEKKEKKK